MFCTPPARIRSAVPAMIAWAPKEIACWLEPHCRSTVHTGYLFGKPGGEPGVAGDVAGLRADGVQAAHDRVLDGAGVDVDPVEDAAERQRAQVDGMDLGQ